MPIATEIAAFDGVTSGVVEVLSTQQAREIIAYRPSSELQERVALLAERANEGELTADERAEYLGYVRANSFVAALQARARRFLRQREET